MKRVYQVLAWAIVLLGAGHMFATTRSYPDATANALWFFSGGLLIAMSGVLNLLNASYGSIAAGVKRVTVGANVVMTLFSFTAGKLTNASTTGLIVIVGLMAITTILSFLRIDYDRSQN